MISMIKNYINLIYEQLINKKHIFGNVPPTQNLFTEL